MEILKTEFQEKKEADDMAVYQDYKALSANPENRATAISEALMKKHNIYSRATIWKIIQRVEKRLGINQ